MGSRVQSAVGCFPELCFLPFPVAQVLVGLNKQFINNFVSPTPTNNNRCFDVLLAQNVNMRSCGQC